MTGNYNLDCNKCRELRSVSISFVFFLPERDYLGRRVIFYRTGVSNPMAPNIGYDVLTLMTLVFDLAMDDEENQIRGVIHVSDAKGIRMPHFTIFSPQYMFRVGKNTEVRVNEIHQVFSRFNEFQILTALSRLTPQRFSHH